MVIPIKVARAVAEQARKTVFVEELTKLEADLRASLDEAIQAASELGAYHANVALNAGLKGLNTACCGADPHEPFNSCAREVIARVRAEYEAAGYKFKTLLGGACTISWSEDSVG